MFESSSTVSTLDASTPPTRGQRLWRGLRTVMTYVLMLLAVLLGTHWVQTRQMPLGVAPDAVFARAYDGSTQHHADAASSLLSSPHVDALGEFVPLHTLEAWRQQHTGQPVVLYFWGSWCHICRLEQPLINSFIESHPVLPIALQSGHAAKVAAYERQHGLRWNSAVDADGRIAAAFGVRGTPAFIVLDANGHIASRTIGMTTPWGLRLRLWQARL